MAIFGLPGGAEWLVIGGTVLLLFFPGALLVWLGFVLGRRSASKVSEPDASPPSAPDAPDDDTTAEAEHGD
jgi:hypothetical protein